MPQLTKSTSVAAGAVNDNIFTNWQYQYIPRAGRIKIIARATAATLLSTISAGSETLQEESPIQAGGTAGVTPSELNTPPAVFDVAAGDIIKYRVRSTDAGAQTVDAIIYYFPH